MNNCWRTNDDREDEKNMTVPFLDLQAQLEPIKEEIHRVALEVIDSGKYILGEEVKVFEKEIAEYLGVRHAIGVANGSDALLLSLMASGVREGDEVITTPFTFFATAGAIARLGAKPVFVDIKKDSLNIDPSLIEEKITDKTKVIIPVHIFGQPADMDEINRIAKRFDLKVIEDACQAIGSEYHGKKAGSIGHLGCFSFFPTKNLGCFGDGGMVTTNDDRTAEFVRKARVHGSNKKYYHEFVGFNSRLDNLQAAVLRVKLPLLDDWNNKRQEIAKQYSEALSDKLEIPKTTEGRTHTFHQYALLAKDQKERETIMDKLREKGIATGIYYPVPLHLQECFKQLGYKKGDMPVAEEISKRIFSIPIYPEVDVEEVIRSFGKD